MAAAKSAAEAYRKIAHGLADALPTGGGFLGEDARRWVEQTAESMLAWTVACERLSPN